MIEWNESSNYRPGEPLRPWSLDSDITATDFRLLVQRADARDVLVKLYDDDRLSKDDRLILACLNSWCVITWYEPISVLINGAQISEEVRALIAQELMNKAAS